MFPDFLGGRGSWVVSWFQLLFYELWGGVYPERFLCIKERGLGGMGSG